MSGPSAQSESRELNSGLILAGAYAGKIRRTLFAQLRDLARQDKDFNREIARASAELNVVLYNILVNELKIDKGDVVRIRVNYDINLANKKISWNYNTLKVEVFRRLPDEQVVRAVNSVTKDRLDQILETFRLAPRAAEEVVKTFELAEEEKPEAPTVQLPPERPKLRDLIASIDIIGETVNGGYLIKFSNREGSSKGIATLTPSGDEVVIDAVIIYEGHTSRYIIRCRGKPDMLVNEPSKILEGLEKASPTPLTREQAEAIIREKMQSAL